VLRFELDLVFTAVAAPTAAPTVSALDCLPAWGGLRFFVEVVPNGDLALDLTSSGLGGAAVVGCGLLATFRPGICVVEPNPPAGVAPAPAAVAAAPVAAAAPTPPALPAPNVESDKPVPEGEYAGLAEGS